jgi:hypothetical protein
MKPAALGMLVFVGATLIASGFGGQRDEAFAQFPAAANPMTSATSPVSAAAAGSELIVVSSPATDKGQILTVVDQRQKVISVYHVDGVNGKIALCSVRNIQGDLQMPEYNTGKPLPTEIQSSIRSGQK